MKNISTINGCTLEYQSLFLLAICISDGCCISCWIDCQTATNSLGASITLRPTRTNNFGMCALRCSGAIYLFTSHPPSAVVGFTCKWWCFTIATHTHTHTHTHAHGHT